MCWSRSKAALPLGLRKREEIPWKERRKEQHIPPCGRLGKIDHDHSEGTKGVDELTPPGPNPKDHKTQPGGEIFNWRDEEKGLQYPAYKRISFRRGN